MKTVTLDDMINCARRELVMRENVYPKLVESGKMQSVFANHETDRMKAIVTLLTNIKYDGTKALDKLPQPDQGFLF